VTLPKGLPLPPSPPRNRGALVIVVGLRASGRASEWASGRASEWAGGGHSVRLRFVLSVRLRFSHRLFRKVTEWRGGTVIGRELVTLVTACYKGSVTNSNV